MEEKESCPFCMLIKDEKTKKIHEDDKCVALLDIHPARPGHILLVPKEHYPVLPLIPPDLTRHLMIVAKQLSNKLLGSLNVKGTTIFIANGAAAGQKVPHVIIHIIPREELDGLALEPKMIEVSDEEVMELLKNLKPKVQEHLSFEMKSYGEEK